MKERWGPFLYELAMEVTSISHNGLMCDRGAVSPEARIVWQKFFSRNDIKTVPLPDSCLSSIVTHSQLQYMNFSYMKTPATSFNSLKLVAELQVKAQ